MQRTPMRYLHTVFLGKETEIGQKNMGLCPTIESKATCKNSADLDKNKKKALKFTWVGYARALNPSIITMILFC